MTDISQNREGAFQRNLRIVLNIDEEYLKVDKSKILAKKEYQAMLSLLSYFLYVRIKKMK